MRPGHGAEQTPDAKDHQGGECARHPGGNLGGSPGLQTNPACVASKAGAAGRARAERSPGSTGVARQQY